MRVFYTHDLFAVAILIGTGD